MLKPYIICKENIKETNQNDDYCDQNQSNPMRPSKLSPHILSFQIDSPKSTLQFHPWSRLKLQ